MAVRPLDPAVVIGGLRVAAIPASRVRAVEAVEVELTLPELPVLALRLPFVARDEAGTVSVEEGFLVVVGTKPDDGFRCDCRSPAEVEADSEFGAGRLAGAIGDDGVLRLLTFNEGARGAMVAPSDGIEDVGLEGEANRGSRDMPGACMHEHRSQTVLHYTHRVFLPFQHLEQRFERR